MTTRDVPYGPSWDERRISAIEAAFEKYRDDREREVAAHQRYEAELQAEVRALRVTTEEIKRRLDRTTAFAMASSALFVAVLGFLAKVLTG